MGVVSAAPFSYMKTKRNKHICGALKTLWDSLDSHMDATYAETYKKLEQKIAKENFGNRKFHVKTIREYTKAIYDLSLTLDE